MVLLRLIAAIAAGQFVDRRNPAPTDRFVDSFACAGFFRGRKALPLNLFANLPAAMLCLRVSLQAFMLALAAPLAGFVRLFFRLSVVGFSVTRGRLALLFLYMRLLLMGFYARFAPHAETIRSAAIPVKLESRLHGLAAGALLCLRDYFSACLKLSLVEAFCAFLAHFPHTIQFRPILMKLLNRFHFVALRAPFCDNCVGHDRFLKRFMFTNATDTPRGVFLW